MADGASAPERIRRYLDEHGSTDVSAGQIWVTFSLDSPAREERTRVSQQLVDAGVSVEPPLTDLDDPDTRVVLRPRRVEIGEFARPLVGAGAAATLLGSFLPWYTGSRGGIEVPDVSTGWEWLGVLDIYLLALGIAALSWLIAHAGPATARALAGASALGMVAVLYRVASPPDERFQGLVLNMDVGVGPFVCLLGTAAILGGAASRSLGESPH